MTPSSTSSRRVLLFAVAGTMIAAAALAIAILLFGDFGGTEGRILLTTLVLAAHGALAVPAAILRDQRRLPGLALGGAALLAVAAALNLTAIWWNTDSDLFGKTIVTAWALVVPTVVASALAGRPRRHGLFLPSVGLGYLAAALLAVAVWAETEHEGLFRVLGALVVLTVLLVALQPLLLRARHERTEQSLRIVEESGETTDVVVEADSHAEAVARAIRDAEREGRHVRSVELLHR